MEMRKRKELGKTLNFDLSKEIDNDLENTVGCIWGTGVKPE